MKKYAGLLAINGYFGLLLLLSGAYYGYWHEYMTDMSPEQPIAFSHQIHVGKAGLDCAFCHTYADKGTNPGIPSLQKCMDCHTLVAKDRPEIKKLHKYWEDKEPIPWNKVNYIPVREYIYFSHKRHIKAGLDCATCHGQVKTMAQVKQVRTFKMGMCISCHETKKASTDCLTCHK